MSDEYLEEKRNAIAETDKEIIALLKKRLDLAKEIGQYKAKNGMEVRNLDIEKRVVDRYRYLAAEYGMDPDRLEIICRTIMKESVETETAIVAAPETKMKIGESKSERPDVAKEQKTMLVLGVLSVTILLALALVAGFALDPNKGANIVLLVSAPIALIALCFYLGYKDLPTGETGDEIGWIKKRTLIFGGLMVGITALVLMLLIARSL